MTRTKNDYIFAHPQSRNLYVRYRGADGKRHVESLGTSDRREADVIAGPLITAHKARLLAARPHIETKWELQFPPGLHTEDGVRIFATPTELHYLDDTGQTTRTEPNGFMSHALVNVGHPVAFSADREFRLFDAADNERPKVATKGGDDAILETYLTHNNLSSHFRREAEATWATYKSLIGKPLKTATREDGRLLVKHFADAGNKSATIAKKLGWLRAACELAIGEKKLSFNPFVKIIPKNNDKLRRKALDDAAMTVLKNNLAKLSESDQLLFRVLGTTGMRLSEAFQINGEQTEEGIRFSVVGTKTDASLRRVPFPADLLDHLPPKITGRLFAAKPSIELAAKAASKRLNDFIDDCGFKDDKSLVVHSLRHRAARRLRRAGVPRDIRRAIGGWVGGETEDASEEENYGVEDAGDKGYAMPMLKEAIDKIGFDPVTDR